MELTVVGASGSISGPESPASCYLVRAPWQGRTYALLLDLGPGALGVLHRFCSPAEIDAVLLSHLHPDHCLDLCGLYVQARYSGPVPWPAPLVHGPTGTADRIARAYAAGPADSPADGPGGYFRFRDWSPVQDVGPFRVRVVRVDHPVEAYAIRLDAADGSLVYSGDTGPCPALAELARGADLLLCEAAYRDGRVNPPGLHLTGSEAGAHAASAGVGRLMLTHIPPWLDPADTLAAARTTFTGPVELARTGSTWSPGGSTR